MPSRRDELQSYQFMVQRVVSALVQRETDPAQSPFRRAAGATMASILIAVVVAAGFGIYGVFTGKGDKSWKQDGAVIVEKGTGAAYVWRENKLHPTLNLTSAYLASSVPKPPKFDVPSKSLQDVPWGPTLGVPMLPDSLPDPKNGLVRLPWAVCSLTLADRVASAVALGDQPLGGRVVGTEEAIIVESSVRASSGGTLYMLWRGRAYELIDDAAAKMRAGKRPTPVSPAYLKGAPSGNVVRALAVSGAGQPWANNPAWKVGEVLTVTGGPEQQYALVKQDGLFWINEFQGFLLGTSRENEVTLSTITGYKPQDALLPTGNGPLDPPTRTPKIGDYGGSLCSVFKDEAGNAELRADVQLRVENQQPTATRTDKGQVLADYVLVPHGKGAIVASGQTVSLIAQNGVRYAATGPDVVSRLGYEGVTPVKLPSAVLALLPEGPGLDPQQALKPVEFR